MKANKSSVFLAALAAVSTLTLSACGSIGDGNAPVSMELKVAGASEDAEVFACQVSSPSLEVTFSNGSVGNFFNQGRGVEYESSDPDVVAVSDGTFASPDGQFFVPGLLIPKSAGTAVITAKYLTFTDSVDVTVSPVSLDITPKRQVLAQGQSVFLKATGVLDGDKTLAAADFSNLGQWTVPGEEEETSAGTIVANSGLYSAREGAAGTDTVTFEIDFCDTSVSAPVKVVNQTLQSLHLASARNPDDELDEVVLPPDASFGIRAIGRFSGGLEQDLTSRVGILVADDEIGFANLRGLGQLTSFSGAGGQSTTVKASFDPDSEVEGDEVISADIPFKVLDVTLDRASLDIAPKDALMLPGTTLQYAATGQFDGPDGPQNWDLTRDVVWSSDDPSLVGLLNSNGSRGLAIASGGTVGATQVAAQRVAPSSDEEQIFPEVDVTVAALTEDDPVAQIQALHVAIDDTDLVEGAIATLTATADIGPQDQTVNSQDISSGVVWFSSDPQAASISNADSSRGVVTVLSDQADQTVTLTARFFDTRRQEQEFTDSIEVILNPSPPEEATATEAR